MTFIRIKNLKGKQYAYLVENEWTSNGSRQKVKAYLGRVIKPERTRDEVPDITNKSFQESVITLLKSELENHDLDENIKIDLENKKLTKNNRDIVLALNEGFVCEHTITEAINFKSQGHEEKVGEALATVLVEAGLKLPKDIFVALFEKIFKSSNNPV